jgi:hypothetical protein
MEGGLAHFPGLNAPIAIDTETLPPPERQRLEGLVSGARLLERPPSVGSSAGKADQRTFLVSVENAGQSHAVRVIEPIEDPGLQLLIDELQRRQREQRSSAGGAPR